jgi:hypothetical protein
MGYIEKLKSYSSLYVKYRFTEWLCQALFSFYVKIIRRQVKGYGSQSDFVGSGWVEVLDNITDNLTLDNNGKHVWRVSCFLQVNDNVLIFRKKLADTNVYLYRPTKDSILFEWLSKVVTPDGSALPLVYIIYMLLTLFFF